MSKGISTFETVAREHVKQLQEAGEPPEQIVMQLSAVATSYDSDGLADEARVLRELVAQYRLRPVERGAS